MFHLDRFTYHLQEGNNTIVRNITDSPYFTSDDRMFSDTYRDILSAKAGNTTYKMETFDLNSTYAWPLRFALPLGTPDGFPYRFFVVAFQENVDEEEPRSLLYPFDRQIKNEKMFFKVPNFYSHVAPVYYKGY
ncbi:unnamed protein product [Acanthoscelides obtectus]|nr:unnamed protein product [Acanthoscelides obtectus]CAK1637722.1 hypothetical protein AOBTE_LOCUS10150 [Acanthoscelides obtectus]